MKLRHRAGAALAILTLALGAGCSGSGGGGHASASPSPSAAPEVRTVRIDRATIHPTIVLPGAIAPSRTVSLSNVLSEPTASVYVREGDRVHVGQVIARLDTDDLEASLAAAIETAHADDARTATTSYSADLTYAQAPQQVRQASAQLAQAEETLREARRNLDRDVRLEREGYLPTQNLDEQRVVVATDAQAIRSSQAQLASAVASESVNGTPDRGLQAANVASMRAQARAQYATAEQLRREIARGVITSPVDGVVVNRNLNPGEYPSGRQIFTIETSDPVYAILTASAQQAYEVRGGDRVAVERAGFARGSFLGTVEALLDPATAGSTNYTVKVAVPNPTLALRAGTPVQGIVDLGGVTGAAVPTTAFVDDQRTRVALVVDGHVRMRRVAELATDGVTSIVAGLPLGALAVRVDGATLDDGSAVRIARR